MKISKHSSPYANRLALFRRPSKVARAVALAAMVTAAGLPFLVSSAQAANTVDLVTGTDLSLPASYSTGLPTAANDVLFGPASATAATTFTTNGAALTYGSLDDTNTNALTITDSNATASTITLGGTGFGGNSVSGTAADLLYVAAGSNLTITGAGTGTLKLALGQDGNFDVAGTLTDTAAISGAFNLTKSGVGTLSLSANTFGGAGHTFTIQDGAVVLNSTTSYGAAATQIVIGSATTAPVAGITISSGASGLATNNTGGVLVNQNFTVAGGNAFTVAGTGAMTLAGPGTTRTITDTSSSSGVVFANAISAAAGSTITNLTVAVTNLATTNLALNGVISDGGASGGLGFTKAGIGIVTLNAANTFTGAATVSAGTLNLSGAAGSIATNTVNVAGGTLNLVNTGAGNNAINRISDTATVTLSSGTFVLGGSDQASTNVTENIGTFALGAGAVAGTTSIVTVAPGSNATPGSTNLNAGSFTRNTGSVIGLVNGAGLGSSAASTSRFTFTTSPTLIGAGTPAATGDPGTGAPVNTGIVAGLVGEATVATGGTGTATGAANTFLTYTATGGLRPLNPTDEFSTTLAAGNNDRITATASATGVAVNSLIIAPGATTTLTLTGTLTDASNMILFAPTTASVASTITGGTVAFGATEGLVYAGGLTGGNQTIASAITGSNGITVSGPGNVVFSGAVTLSGGTLTNSQHFLTLSNTGNNFAGASIVTSAGNGGILFNQALTAFNGASRVTATNGSQIRFNGATQGIFSNVPITLGDGNTSGNIYLQRSGDNADFTYPGQITLSSPTPAVIQGFNAGSNSYIFNGGITGTGTGGLELQGNGGSTSGYLRTTLAGTLNYAGPTYLSNTSNLRVALNATTLPAGTVLNFRPSTTAVTAQFDLNGNNQTVAGLQSLGTSTGPTQVINSSATASVFTVNNTANNVFSGNLGTVGALNPGGTVTNTTGGSTTTVILAAGTANNFSVVKGGAGMLTLTGANSYTGATTINAGTLLLSTGTINGSTSVTVNNGGALTLSNAAALADAGTLSLFSGSALGLNAASGTTETIGSLFLDGTQINGGTYSASDLMGLDSSINFSSLNGETLTVVNAVPEPSTYVGGLILLAALGWNLRGRSVRRSV